jgi:hypothetical protein
MSSICNHFCSTLVFDALYSKSLSNTYLVFLFLSGFLFIVFMSSESMVVDECLVLTITVALHEIRARVEI